MKRIISIALIIVFLLTAFHQSQVGGGLAYSGIPTFSIVSVVTDKTVKIITNNFPANDEFTVRMGAYGTLGIGGIVVGTTKSGSGGSFTVSYTIPAALSGSYRIAIRLQSSKSGYYAYNWFYNKTSADGTTPKKYSGYPWIKITSVKKDKKVTIQGYNFPPNDSFNVTMGAYGTRGIGGTLVATTDTDGGGSFSKTYKIPASLAGSYRIAIRLQSPTSGYYAYNWFYNNTTNGTGVPAPTPKPGAYTGYPTFKITSVQKNNTVTIQGYNFPADDKFTVTMGAYGTKGVGGIKVTTTATGKGGSLSETYKIPSDLYGSYRIAIRLQSPTSGYYAYNWFYNNTTTP